MLLILLVSTTITEDPKGHDPVTPTKKSRAGVSLVQEMSDTFYGVTSVCALIIILRKPNSAKRPHDVDATQGEQIIRKSPRKRYAPSMNLNMFSYYISVFPRRKQRS